MIAKFVNNLINNYWVDAIMCVFYLFFNIFQIQHFIGNLLAFLCKFVYFISLSNPGSFCRILQEELAPLPKFTLIFGPFHGIGPNNGVHVMVECHPIAEKPDEGEIH
jgi:hypothetical protein